MNVYYNESYDKCHIDKTKGWQYNRNINKIKEIKNGNRKILYFC